MSNEFSNPKLTPADAVKIPGVDGNNDSGYLLSKEVKDYMVGGVFGTTEEYSSLLTYEYGKRLLHEGIEYRCIIPVETPEVFDADKWEAISLASLDENIEGKLDISKVYNGLDQTSEGYALDARQGKVLNDAISSLFSLLWTNPDYHNAFTPQTIQLDLSSYKAIVVVAQDHTSRPDWTSVFCRVDGGTYVVLCPYNSGSKIDGFSMRRITPDSTGVYFGSGINTVGVENTNAIPIYIYGIK